MNSVVESIGIIGACCIALSLFPQTIKTIKTKSMKDIAIPFVLLTMTGAACQLLYGIYKKVTPMIVANTCVIMNTIILLFYKIYVEMYIGSPDHLPFAIEASCNADKSAASSLVTLETTTKPILENVI